MINKANKNNSALLQNTGKPNVVPDWILVTPLSFSEKLEFEMHRLTTMMPVCITFFLFTYLMLFYTYVSQNHFSSISHNDPFAYLGYTIFYLVFYLVLPSAKHHHGLQPGVIRGALAI